ncbi:AraC family transcriptional regulator ligand-binding domain-containing protein [Nocardia concava]|uniref:AraC family transcriptional regulator ligand-binding domain-containing protein n=1 Tax=Nocardia concava TaxID=257281 RepID=UPI000684EEB6|nr:helix-turn-helix domain-containing protein [Nocardia concava]
MLEGTVSTRITRALMDAAVVSGSDPAHLVKLVSLSDAELADDLVRPPTAVADNLWALLPAHDLGSRLTRHLITSLPAEGLGLWSHLITAAASALDGLRDAVRYLAVLADPATETAEIVENGGLITLRYTTSARYDPHAQAALQEYAPTLILEHLRRASGRPITPVHAQFQHGPRPARADLIDLIGTRNLDFGAESNAMTFLTSDLLAPNPGVRPGLADLLRRHAELTATNATRPATWHDTFRAALTSAMRDNDLSLAKVAAALALSPRTLQRRLAEHGTTWRAEVDRSRRDISQHLLNDTDLTTHTVAARIGYRDARALRRANRRWHGHPPSALRKGRAAELTRGAEGYDDSRREMRFSREVQ